MSRAQLIPLGAGVVAALLHLSVTLGSPGAFLFGYLAQAPIAATGLALGFMPAAVAAAFAAILVALGSPGVGALTLFVLTSALPILVVIYFALQSRAGEDENGTGGVTWYPTGRILGWLTALGLGAFVLAYLVFIGEDKGIRGAIERYFEIVRTANPNADPAMVNEAIATVSQVFPAGAVASWILMNIVNAVLAQHFLTRAGKNIRPKPAYRETEPLLWPLGVVVLGGMLMFFGGEPGFFGLNILLIAAVPFFFIGLAVLHSISAAWPGRPVLLVGVYALILLRLPAAFIALAGILEYWLRLRDRIGAQNTNKGNE